MTDKTPITFATELEEKRRDRRKSDLSNLASAYELLSEDNDRLRAQIADNEKLKNEIVAYAQKYEAGDGSLDGIKELYGRATKQRNR